MRNNYFLSFSLRILSLKCNGARFKRGFLGFLNHNSMLETNIEKMVPLGGQPVYVAITLDNKRVPVSDDDYKLAIELAKLPNIRALIYQEPKKFTIIFGSSK